MHKKIPWCTTAEKLLQSHLVKQGLYKINVCFLYAKGTFSVHTTVY